MAATNVKGGGYADKPIGEALADIVSHIKFLSAPISQTPAGDINGFDVEFKFIERRCEKPDFQKSYDAAERPENRTDETRVGLDARNGVVGSDYINANYIAWGHGHTEETENHYISTQGPLPNTVADFWRMVWEQQSRIVVMLTKEIESGRVKCVKYWPDKDSHLYDEVRVKMDSLDNSVKELTIRVFSLEHAKTGEKRIVTHYQYKEWPDHGLPSSTKVFMRLVNSAQRLPGDGPIVVHCSAGIGRSGTFCAVHSIVQHMHQHVADHGEIPPINLVETVLALRDQRPGMVQTKEQYMFCYLAVQEEFLKLQHLIKKAAKKGELPKPPLSRGGQPYSQ